jgi:hypothetical protein
LRAIGDGGGGINIHLHRTRGVGLNSNLTGKQSKKQYRNNCKFHNELNLLGIFPRREILIRNLFKSQDDLPGNGWRPG